MAGAPPATAVDGNEVHSVSDIESGRVVVSAAAAAAPASSSSVPATFASAATAAGGCGGTSANGGVVAPSSSPTAAGASSSSSVLSSAALLALAGPENYEHFPQPFSGLDVPVRPYARSASRSSGGGGGGGSGSGFGDTEAGGGLERQDDGGFVSSGGGQEGEELGGGREEGWVRPEIDVADLVMDNNEFYTPHGKSGGGGGDYNNDNNNNGGYDDDSSTYSSHTISTNKALRDAVVIVAVASAEMKALQRKNSCSGGGGSSGGGNGSNRSDSCRRPRFDTAADEGSVARGGLNSVADVDDNGHPSLPRKDGKLEAAAKAGGAAAAAAASSSAGLSAGLFRDETPPLPPGGGVTTPGKDSTGVWRSSAGNNPTNVRDNRAAGGGLSAGSQAAAAPVASTPLPPTPRSLPGLLSMSFDNNMMVEEGLRQSQPRLSPPSVLRRSQERRASEQHKAWQQQQQQQHLRRLCSSSVGSSGVSTITSGSSSGSHDFDDCFYDGGANDDRVGRHQQRIAAKEERGAGDCTLRPFLSYASIMSSCGGGGSSGELAPGDSPTLPSALNNNNRDDAATAPPTEGANNGGDGGGGGGGADGATGKDEAKTPPSLQADSFDTGRLTDTVGWEGSPKSRGGVGDGVSGKARVVDRANFDTAPLLACGDKASTTVSRPGGAGARGGAGVTGAPTELFDSTKKWFGSMGKGDVEGGGRREVVGVVDNGGNAQLGSQLEGTE
ncbi:unnamed protein product [Ectocarpus sp. CCAP 1310/34]|nr:unnamed protein product [Ectocarpus sp. CCAP 1310/34]